MTMFSIFNNVHTDAHYRASCGLSLSDFNELFEVFEKIYETKKEVLYAKKKQPVLTDKREALFFILYHLKTGVTFRILGISFGFSSGTAQSYVERLKPYLKKSLETLGCVPKGLFSNQEEFDKAFEGIEDLYIDCTEIPVERACEYEKQKLFYSGKKKDTP